MVLSSCCWSDFSDGELILYIIRGLGPEYEAIVVNLTSRQDAISLHELQFMLQSQECVCIVFISANLSNASAHYV